MKLTVGLEHEPGEEQQLDWLELLETPSGGEGVPARRCAVALQPCARLLLGLAAAAGRYACRSMIEVQLTASNFQLELASTATSSLEFDTGRDANALALRDRARHHGLRLDLHASHSPLILYTFELASFVDQLRALEYAHNGKAALGNPDPQSGDELGLTIQLTDGGGMLDGFLTDNVAARLSFEIDVDRALIRDALAQFAAIVEAFPVRGDITAD